MKKLLVMLFVLSSNLTFASYHGGGGGESDMSGGGGGYGGGSSVAGALVGVGLIAYFVMNRSDEEEAEFVDQNNFKKFQIDFSKEENSFNSFSENDFYQNDFQVNFKYYLN